MRQFPVVSLTYRADLHPTFSEMSWVEFVDNFLFPATTKETEAEFAAFTPQQKTETKDVGGYIAGRNTEPRKMRERSILVLDADHATPALWQDFTLLFSCTALLHSTHSHTEASPRYRICIPLNRDVTPAQYEELANKFIHLLGEANFDKTCAQPNRLMFWPSVCKDAKYVLELQNGELLDVDKYLKVEKAPDFSLQANPREKEGLIGAFCRAFTVPEAIDRFLSDVYTPHSHNCYTYSKSSTVGGLKVYNGDMFAFSYHESDPTCGKMCNAFDLVRLHLFQKQSEKKSMSLMLDLCADTEEVAEQNKEDDWRGELKKAKNGNILSTISNILAILRNDSLLKGAISRNAFDSRVYIKGQLPWRESSGQETIRNVDYSGIRCYIEDKYGVCNNSKLSDAIEIIAEEETYHPVKEYLNSLKWDGKKRVDTLLLDLFEVEDSYYTRSAFRKTVVGAVKRVFEPGCKFDTVLTLFSHNQGTGKSSFFRALGGAWFSDSFTNIQSKDCMDAIQGKWIIEMGELSSLRQADVNAAKHFFSKEDDHYRKPYAACPETFKRQCIFVGTTNDANFLKDDINRRFWPISINSGVLTNNEKLKRFISSQEEINQIWAEAVELYKKGETTYLDSFVELEARATQGTFREVDEFEGIIENYLSIKLPEEWDTLGVYERQAYITDASAQSKGVITRKTISIIEVWCEVFGNLPKTLQKKDSLRIGKALRVLEGWEESKGLTKQDKEYGRQRYFKRKKDVQAEL
jgi:predicted P-loop ATPase